MNKMIFNEGGQPVCLDDLRLLQENPADQLGVLLQTLSGGCSVFLMNGLQAEAVDIGGQVRLKIRKNWLVTGKGVLELPETEIIVSSSGSLYIGLRKTGRDVRVFEDGQEHACTEETQAYYSAENTGGETYNANELKTLFSLMAPLVKDNEPVVEYRDVKVTFLNGYSGKVQYKNMKDRVRVYIDVKSSSYLWTDGQGLLFYIDEIPAPIPSIRYVSPKVAVGGDTANRFRSAEIAFREAGATLEGIELDDDTFSPASCSVHVIFDVLNK